MVMRYTHLSDELRREAGEKIVQNSLRFPLQPLRANPVTPYAPVAQLDRAFHYESRADSLINSELIAKQ
jgi:hypothetical protein